MSIWTVVVGDRPAFVFSAESEVEARQATSEDSAEGWVKLELLCNADENGQPVWDGEEESLTLRLATSTEYGIWRKGYNSVREDEDFDIEIRQNPDAWGTFLFPTRDQFDDDD